MQLMLSIWVAGAVTGLALIVAIGAQNAFVLHQGLRREHVGVVVTLCTVSDAVLITVGTLGIGLVVTQAPAALMVLKWVGAVYLMCWAARSFAASLKPSALVGQAARSRGSVVGTTLAVTYLNPHVYLDTVVLLGGLANQHGLEARWVFSAGAVTASAAWFPALGYGAQALSALLSSPRSWQVIEAATGVVMLGLSVKLMLH
jgi:L-lysine exporter family protein LysE/ArgO